MREALVGPPHDADYLPFPAGDASQLQVRAVQGTDAITVDLQHWQEPAAADLGPAGQQQMALQAVVWTADKATGTLLPVRFLVDGQPVASLLSTDTSQPVAPLAADAALSPVSITSPAQGTQVPGTFTVTGMASAPEADVVWELTQDGRVVRHGSATAQECCTLSPYSFTVTAPPGHYVLAVHDSDPSGGEGVGITTDTKSIAVGSLSGYPAGRVSLVLRGVATPPQRRECLSDRTIRTILGPWTTSLRASSGSRSAGRWWCTPDGAGR